jgi:hypothetical protein
MVMNESGYRNARRGEGVMTMNESGLCDKSRGEQGMMMSERGHRNRRMAGK